MYDRFGVTLRCAELLIDTFNIINISHVFNALRQLFIIDSGALREPHNI